MVRVAAVLCVMGCAFFSVTEGVDSTLTLARLSARPCEPVEVADSAEIWSDAFRRVLLRGVRRDTLAVVPWYGTEYLWLARRSRDSLGVVIAGPGNITHVVVVGLVLDGCLGAGGGRSVGWGLRMNDSATARWNVAFQTRDPAAFPVVADARSALDLAALYLSFSTGVPARARGLADSLRMEVTPSREPRSSADIRMAAYRREGRWEVNGVWHVGGRDHSFLFGFASSGLVLESHMEEQRQKH